MNTWETPGTDGGDRVVCFRDRTGKRRTIAHVYGQTDTIRDHNAKLIAAAPDLLAACKRVLGAVDSGEMLLPAALGVQLSNAISKAEGR